MDPWLENVCKYTPDGLIRGTYEDFVKAGMTAEAEAVQAEIDRRDEEDDEY